ncbi:hypothetical protein [Magnetovibrio blakemorei]|uniref:Cytochrome C n=1 Tax=Magnetovibrio blakemorei TaxID=28181 RepID=A0A1E5QAZ0_9PROT|nr:hypothetical protein [Magnetovibrio blakemorei]OEJ69200.1 hypothetical protein BEN30_03660 [Magnetovibrio blakemorei]
MHIQRPPVLAAPVLTILVTALALIAATPGAQADGAFPPITNPDVVRECSDCHLLYRPEMLPAASWKAIMGNLGAHFGEDATLAEPLRTDIEAYHVSHASDVSGARQAQKFLKGVDLKNPPIRISATPRFTRKHDELDPAVFTTKDVGSKAHCNACHREAKDGLFDEDTVKIPGYINLPFGINIKPLW